MGLERIVQSQFFRGEVKSVDDGGGVQTIQTSGLAGYVDEAEHVQPYGFRSRCKAGAQTIIARLGAVGALVAWVFDGRYKVTLDEGEVAIFDDQGQTVHIKRAGIEIAAKSGAKVAIKNDTDVTGTVDATAGFAFNGADGKTGILTITIGAPAPVGVATIAIAGGIITNVSGTGSCVWLET